MKEAVFIGKMRLTMAHCPAKYVGRTCSLANTSMAFILSEVVKRTGARRRSVQLWADDGDVLVSTPATDRAGTGVHREFSGQEVRLTAILVPLAKLGIQIGKLKQFALKIRPLLRYVSVNVNPDPSDQRARQIAVGLRRAVEGVGENYMLFAYTESQIAISVHTDADGSVAINPFREFAELDGLERSPIVVIDLTSILYGLLE